jgi:molybdenum cofactor cytidylyltransferase
MSACLPMAAIILAAGQSSRMGTAKQLLVYKGEPLVLRAVRTAREAGFAPTVVVTGANAQAVAAAIAAEPVEIAWNCGWQAGMGSSITAGLLSLQGSGTDVGGAAILLSDQPLLTAAHLREMRRLLFAGAAAAIAAEYGSTLGVPALFKRQLFGRLLHMPADAGAKALLQSPDLVVTRFPLPEAAVDIDTPVDFARLTAEQ